VPDKGPAAAARRALGEKRAGAAVAEPPAAPARPPSAPPTPPPSATRVDPAATDDNTAPEPVDVRSIRPLSPTEVVQLAGLHLGVHRDAVVQRASELLGPASGGRSPDELALLWQTLVDENAAPADLDPDPLPPDDDPHPTSTDPDDIDLNELVDAPAHADELIERLTEAFPGAELQTKEEPDQS